MSSLEVQKFCDRVTVVKPLPGHVLKSSFYTVTQNFHSHHPEAIRAEEKKKEWEMIWTVATFGIKKDYARQVACSHQASTI
jgi:hypothetical protein